MTEIRITVSGIDWTAEQIEIMQLALIGIKHRAVAAWNRPPTIEELQHLVRVAETKLQTTDE